MAYTPQYPRSALAVILLLVLSCVALMAVAGHKYTHITGINNIVEDARGRLLVNLNDGLVRLTADGALETQFNFGDRTLGGRHTAFAPMPDGRWWLGNYDKGTLQLMSEQGTLIRSVAPPASAGPFFGAFHLGYEPKSRRLIVSDSQNHRLLAFDAEGHFIGVSARGMNLRYPTGLAALPQGTLLLANMNRHLAMTINPDLTEAGLRFEGGNLTYRYSEFVSAAADGRAYVTWHDHNLEYGAIAAYAADGHFLHVLPLGDKAMPLTVAARSDDVLAAWKTDDRFSLHHFDSTGRDLGEFGDTHLQSFLRIASDDKVRWRRIRELSKLGAMLGAIGLLLVALRLRRQQEKTAAASVMPPVPAAPAGQTMSIAFGVVGAVLLLALVQTIGCSTILANSLASHGQYHPLEHSAVWITALLWIVIATAWRSSTVFLQLRATMARRAMVAWAPYLPTIMEPGESVLDYESCARYLSAYLLVATNRRLIQLPFEAGEAIKPGWEASWQQRIQAVVLPRPWWLALLNPVGKLMELRASGGRQSARFFAISQTHSEKIIALVRTAREQALQQNPNLPPLAAAVPRIANRLQPSLWRSLLLSLVLPGLGQLNQGRTRRGTVLMSFAAVLLLPTSINWFIAIRRIADQGDGPLYFSAIVYAALVAANLWDVVQFDRRLRTTG